MTRMRPPFNLGILLPVLAFQSSATPPSCFRHGSKMRSIIIAVCAVFLFSCISSRDVSDDRPYWLGFIPGEVYELKIPTVAVACPPEETFRLESSGNLAKCDPEGSARKAEVSLGTRIRVERLEHVQFHAPIQGESYVDVFCVVIGTPVGDRPVKVGHSLCNWKTFKSPDGWPTLMPLPDPSKTTLVRGGVQ